MYLPNQNGIPDDLNFTTTARTPYLIGGRGNTLLTLSVKMLYQLLRACDYDDDVVNLHINFNMKWLETHYGGSV
jgi:hypothetical protein